MALLLAPWPLGCRELPPPPALLLTLSPVPLPWLLTQVWTPWAPASNVQQTSFQFPFKSPAKMEVREKG